jgi:DNA-binding MarR family transcriptional regulator
VSGMSTLGRYWPLEWSKLANPRVSALGRKTDVRPGSAKVRVQRPLSARSGPLKGKKAPPKRGHIGSRILGRAQLVFNCRINNTIEDCVNYSGKKCAKNTIYVTSKMIRYRVYMNDREATSQYEFTMEFFRLLAAVMPGEITLNQVRVVQYINMCSARNEPPPCHKEIAAALEIAPTTLNRALSGFLKAGMVRELSDPKDRRKRLLIMDKSYPGSGTVDRQIKALLARYHAED